MISESITRLLLVRSGGRCAICYRELHASKVTSRSVYLGERGHIVGKTQSRRSPRGEHPLEVAARDDPENLLLVCGACHNEIDHRDNLDVFTVDQLRNIKVAHENRIQRILAVPPENETRVVRLLGSVGASNVAIDRSTAAAAILDGGRVARFLNPDSSGIEIDLRRVPNPDPSNSTYYATCRAIIDQVAERQLSPEVEAGRIPHLSVFALARWPLLVYLGAVIGDKVSSDIYQRHRASESWTWPSQPTTAEFEWSLVKPGSTDEAVLVLSLSAAVHAEEVPAHLSNGAVYRVAPADGTTPHYDVIASPDELKSAERAFRGVFADIEHHRKSIQRLHVLGAAPLSACVALGRVLTRGVHPPMILYDRLENTYQQAMEIN